MSVSLLARIDLTQIYPPFLERVVGMVEEARGQGAHYWAISGFRSYADQTRLHEQGRGKPGPIVTNAKAGESSHNFGIAIDFCRDGVVDRRGLQPDWKPESYFELGEAARNHGLEWGGGWQFKDNPHVQMTGYVTKAQLEPLRQAFEAGGLRGVWDFLDKAGQ